MSMIEYDTIALEFLSKYYFMREVIYYMGPY